MKMYTTLDAEDYREDMLTAGIKPQDVSGMSNGERVILCQCTPFALDTSGEIDMIVVEFEKKLNEIYVDWDDDCESCGRGFIKDGAVTYEGADEEKLKTTCMYGSYVKEIRPEEIIRVWKAKWTDENGLVEV